MSREKSLTAIAKHNKDLVKALARLDVVSLPATSKGALVRSSGGKPTILDGPFAETKEGVSGGPRREV
ncbi:MAG: YciI family protein [Vicinamibacteria bacterium]